GEDPDVSENIFYEFKENQIINKSFVQNGSPHKIWQLTGEFTYNRDSHLISRDQLIYPNHFHRQIDLKSNLQLIFDQKEKVILNYEEPIGDLPPNSLLLPNSNNFGHTILAFFPVLISCIINSHRNIDNIILRKRYKSNSLFSQIFHKLEHLTKKSKINFQDITSKSKRIKNPIITKLSYSHNGENVHVDPSAIKFFREQLGINKNSESELNNKKIIYLKRKDKYRCIVNEPDLIKIIKKYNGKIVEINDLDLKERIKILSDYSIIICTAGGTLANTIFCKPGKTIIEFMPEIYYSVQKNYAGTEGQYISSGLGHNLLKVICKIDDPDEKKSYILKNIFVPLKEFKIAINYAMDGNI
uniref:glycosyltransferase 61 family protein n=1 Tax=uncultured Prochlorococcus sp. TaxID=159733 RepID=UPI00258C699D